MALALLRSMSRLAAMVVQAAPQAMPTFRKLRAGGTLTGEPFERDGEPARYRVDPRRDAAGLSTGRR